MSTASDMLDAALRAAEDVLGNPTFLYRSLYWPCIPHKLTRGMDLGIGPALNQLTRSLTVRKSAIPARTVDSTTAWTADGSVPLSDEDVMPPHPGKRIQYGLRWYEVESVDEDGAGASWVVQLKSPD